MPTYHLRATILPGGDDPRDLWIADGRITFQPQDGAEELASPGAFCLPGLVDCHVHLTMDFAETGLEPGRAEIVAHARREHLASGTLLVRDIGTLNEDATLHLPADDGLPHVHAAGQFLAPADGYFGIQRPTPGEDLPDVAARQVKNGARWVKLIGDWPAAFPDWSRTAVNYTLDAVTKTVERVHAAGARVAVHTTSREAIAQAIAAGVDSIEHGFGMDAALLRAMAAKGIAWTPTIVIEPFVISMSGETGDPAVVAKVRERFEATRSAIAMAPGLGVHLLAGTDMLPPGNVWREVARLHSLGVPPDTALAAATTSAREFLGEPALDEGAPADLVLYEQDPRSDPEVLAGPVVVMLAGARMA